MLSIFVAFVHVLAVAILIGGVSALVSVLCSVQRKGHSTYYDAMGLDDEDMAEAYEADYSETDQRAA